MNLTPYQTDAAKARVYPANGAWYYWRPAPDQSPAYDTRREAEEASVQEWRENLEPQEATP